MSKRAKKEKRPVAKIDFKPYGAAIKAGRTKQKESRNKAADALFISPRYLANIENKGQHPSVQVFLELMSPIISLWIRFFMVKLWRASPRSGCSLKRCWMS